MDQRIKKLAKLFIEHSCRIKKNESVIISADIDAKPLVFELYKRVLLKGAYPSITWGVDKQAWIYYKYASQTQLKNFPKIAMYQMKNADVVIYISATQDKKELADIKPEKITLRQKITKKISDERLKKRWLIFVYPTEAYAKDAGLSLKQFTNFVFNSSLINWTSLIKKMKRLQKVLNKGNKVRIIGKDTDLRFSIKGRKAILGSGEYNMPDGEVFTSPVESTVDGHIKFTYPRYVFGKKVENIFLKFKKGKLIEVKASKNLDKLKALLNTDKGAKSFGEFAFGMNPKINSYSSELLFDEKMNKTIHFALGNAYKECNGKNKSDVHLDIVKDMHKGKIYIDSKLIYEDGKFKI
ncbi:aminopeptidase [Candidatus Pacearchaeota archaeon]|nr:aminopeptidase [Candidatus Pacearchaeota archaeon]